MKNYESVHSDLAKLLGYDKLYCELYGGGGLASITSRVVIDNSTREADAVVERLINFIDCMLEQIQHDEPGRTTDFFILTADDERLQFDAYELALDGDKPEWDRWNDIRTRFLNGNRLELEHQLIVDPDDKVDVEFGMPKLLDDLLQGGRLARWVTLTVIRDNGDYSDWHEFRKPYHQDIWKLHQKEDYFPFLGQRFWMNGSFNGEYVCGEVPFVRDEAAVMGIGSWYQSEQVWHDGDDQEGIYLTLAPNADKDTIDKALTLMGKFYSQLQCSVEIRNLQEKPIQFDRKRERMTNEEYLGLLMRQNGFLSEKISEDPTQYLDMLKENDEHPKPVTKVSPTNAEEVRAFLECFARMREYFTDAEVEELLSRNTELQALYTRHAAGVYTEEEIRLYRFGLCVCLLLEDVKRWAEYKRMLERVHEEDHGAMNISDDMLKDYSAELFEKVASLPEAVTRLPKDVWDNEYYVGMNDLSTQEATLQFYQLSQGIVMRVTDTCLESAEDLRTLEGLMNELSDLEAELQRDYDDPYEKYGESAVRIPLFYAACYSYGLAELWQRLLPKDDPRRGDLSMDYPVLTNREFRDYLNETGDCWERANHVLHEDVYFESMDMGTHARLRFRRENGRYIHEISMLD